MAGASTHARLLVHTLSGIDTRYGPAVGFGSHGAVALLSAVGGETCGRMHGGRPCAVASLQSPRGPSSLLSEVAWGLLTRVYIVIHACWFIVSFLWALGWPAVGTGLARLIGIHRGLPDALCNTLGCYVVLQKKHQASQLD